MDQHEGPYPTFNNSLISASYIGVTLVGIQPSTEPHDLSEHINRAASQTPSAKPTLSLPAQAEPCSSAAEQSHRPYQGQEWREWSVSEHGYTIFSLDMA